MNTVANTTERSPKTSSSPCAKLAGAGGIEYLGHSQDSEKGAIEQSAGKQRRDDRRRLAVGIGKPAVQRGQPHFRAVADQHEQKRDLYPGDLQRSPRCAIKSSTTSGMPPSLSRGGKGQKECAQQRQRDTD